MRQLIKHKKIIILFIILAIILLIALLIILNINNQPENDDQYVRDGTVSEQIDYINEWKGKINNITDLGDYYILKNIINKYYLDYSTLFSEDISEDDSSTIMFDILAKDYIDKYQITKDNIKEHFPQITENEVYLLEGYVVSNFENKKIYIVKCLIRENQTGNLIENDLIVVCDTLNSSFAIYSDDYVKELNLGNIEVGTNFAFDLNYEIEKNSNNLYGAGTKDFDDYCQDIFETFRKLLLLAPEKAYEFLNEDFKNINFPNYSDFQTFINSNRTDIFLMTYSNYELSIEENNNVYNVYDKNDIFYLTFNTESLVNLDCTIQKFV